MTAFPAVDRETFPAWRADPSQWLPIVTDIARAHGLPVAEIKPFRTGTNLVVALGANLVLKVFPPFSRSQFVSERLSLAQLRGRVEVDLPEIAVEGACGDWPYLVITRLDGVVGSAAWPIASDADKVVILQRIGETIAQVQAAPLGAIAELEPRWPELITAQIAGCRARHERLGMPQTYLDGLDEILREAATILPTDAPPVILTGEFIPENFLMKETAGGWRLSGLIDFGDVMAGWREYDLLGPSAFLTEGRPKRIDALFRGFGYAKADRNPALAARLMALLLLHRASDPMRHIAVSGWRERTRSLRDIQWMLWPFR